MKNAILISLLAAASFSATATDRQALAPTTLLWKAPVATPDIQSGALEAAFEHAGGALVQHIDPRVALQIFQQPVATLLITAGVYGAQSLAALAQPEPKREKPVRPAIVAVEVL